MTKLERLGQVVEQKEATMNRFAGVLGGSERLQQPEFSKLYHRAFLAWLYARQFLRIKEEAEAIEGIDQMQAGRNQP